MGILGGTFAEHELDLFLAEDDGSYDAKSKPPPSNEKIATIIDIGLECFYFKMTNAWQISAEKKNAMSAAIKKHKSELAVFPGQLEEDADDEDSGDGDGDDDDSKSMMKAPEQGKGDAANA